MNPLQELVRAGDREGAIALSMSRLSMNPDDGEACGVLARMQLAGDDLASARQTLAAATPAATSHPDVQLSHVLLLTASGQLQQAATRASALAQVAPGRADVHFAAGLALFELGDVMNALGPLGRAVEQAPDHFEYHHVLGEAALEAGSFALAAQAFSQAVTLQPQALRSWQGLAEAFSGLGDITQAEPVVAEGVTLMHRAPSMLLLWSQTLFPAGRSTESLALLEEALLAAPDALAVREELARQLLGVNRIDESLAASAKADSARLGMTRAMAYQASTPPRKEEAVAAYRKALELEPDAWGPANNLGMLLFELGRVDEAVALLEECWTTSGQPQPLLNLALIRVATNHPLGPRPLAQKVLELTDDPSLVEQARRLLGL